MNDNLETFQLNSVGAFQYSATNILDLGATDYTLVSIAVDVSSSVAAFSAELQKTIKEIVKACVKSPRAGNLMLQLIQFSNSTHETHGFKELSSINPDDYDNILSIGGMTALHDATILAIESVANYGENLVKNDFEANGIVFVITDGMDNQSSFGINSVTDSIKRTMGNECLNSLITVLVGVNTEDKRIENYLNDFKNTVGFDQYQSIKEADASSLAKLANFVSQSISSQSQALATGGVSQQLSLTI